MHVFETRLTVLVIAALLTSVAPGRAGAQASSAPPSDGPTQRSTTVELQAAPKDAHLGGVRGTAIDTSAGVLPGVTVVATSVDGRSLRTTVTNATGEFAFDGLPAGPVDLLFHLDGFGDSKTSVTIRPAGSGGPAEPALVHRLELLAMTETITVRADPPPAPPIARPALAPVPAHDPASVCGPAKADDYLPGLGSIRSRRNEGSQGLFAAGDELLIDGGAQSGLTVGGNFVVRRRYATPLTTARNLVVMGEHSSGLLQIVSVDEDVSTAVVIYACDELMTGDYLSPFEPEPARPKEPAGTPAFDKAARILFGDAGQMLGTTHRLLVIDQGARQGVRPGQRVTLFRRSRFGSSTPATIGEAIVVAVRSHSATVRVEQATDVIFLGDGGDWAAPHRVAARENK